MDAKPDVPLNLRAGELVEVRSEREILAALDQDGNLDRFPFMPEMLRYCGKKFRIFKSAHKTCNTANKTGAQRMERAVHLEGVRWDGTAHDGYPIGGLLCWKKVWLRRAGEPLAQAPAASEVAMTACADQARYRAARRPDAHSEEEVFA